MARLGCQFVGILSYHGKKMSRCIFEILSRFSKLSWKDSLNTGANIPRVRGVD